ncbi:MAG: B12-binding domain-containing radical SAM protein, partial [Planctomycetota bacterium]
IYSDEEPLDKYPRPDRSLLNIKGYKYFLNDRLATTIVTGRGCPYHCAFCCKNHGSIRLLSAEKAIGEIDYLHDEFGYNALAFPEDIFILNKQRAETIFAHLKKRDIISRCLVRADVIVKHGSDFVKIMADSGCTGVGMGIESGSDTILKNINKGESIGTIKKAVRMIKDTGIYIKGFFIVGLPGESKETLFETKAFLEDMQLDDVDIKIFQPYPGSPIWENKEAYDIQWSDNINYGEQFYKGRLGEYFGSIKTSNLTTDQIYSEWVSMEGEFKVCQETEC